MSKLVLLDNNEPLTTSLIVSEELKRTHKSITNLCKTYENSFKKFGTFRISNSKSKGGRPEKFYYLNEQQLTFLIMMLRVKKNENDKVLEFKEKITKEFHKMKKWILEQKTLKANEEYQKERKKSKIGRRKETDVIKTFIEYAKKQGSKSAEKYYISISTMENKAFFILKEKFKNVREILNITQLTKIMYADIVVRQALLEGMSKNMKYKEIYQLAKERVLMAASSIGMEEIPLIGSIEISN